MCNRAIAQHHRSATVCYNSTWNRNVCVRTTGCRLTGRSSRNIINPTARSDQQGRDDWCPNSDHLVLPHQLPPGRPDSVAEPTREDISLNANNRRQRFQPRRKLETQNSHGRLVETRNNAMDLLRGQARTIRSRDVYIQRRQLLSTTILRRMLSG